MENLNKIISAFRSAVRSALKPTLNELEILASSIGSHIDAKRVEGLFLPSNVVIMSVLALASYIFVFGPGAHPTSSTLLLFTASSSFCFIIMELIRGYANESNKFNINSLRLTIVSLIIPLMLLRAVGLPQVFVFSTITFLLMSPLVYFIRSKWKISGHMYTFTAITTIMSMFSSWFTPLYLLIPVISWSRLKLKTHSAAQVLAGAALGFIMPYTIASLMVV